MNILTFDIEDWWIYYHYAIGNVQDYRPRLDRYLSEILNLLDMRGFKATFFCLGKVALRYPEVIKKIASHSHQIGCHSHSHRFLGDISPEEFAADTKLALESIEDVIGVKVISYRAPAFSVTEENKWAIEILAANGIQYDCSIFPSKRSFGGFPSFGENQPVRIHYNNSLIREFPISLANFMGKKIAYSGGGYFRLMPYPVIKKIVTQSNYTITYFHIKDFDADQVKKDSLLKSKEPFIIRYFKDYYGIRGAYTKFQRLINDFDFISLEQASAMVDWDTTEIIDL